MCRCRLTELNCVRTKMRWSPEWMQLDTGISISRYFPAMGTAGLLRDLVSGKRRVPRPPPRISETTRGMKPLHSMLGTGHHSGDGNGFEQLAGLFLPQAILHNPARGREMMAVAAGISGRPGLPDLPRGAVS